MNDLTAMLLGMGHDELREKYLKLPFAWPGGKGEQLDKILPHLPPGGSGYGEAFGGSGAVLLNREPTRLDIYNDRYGGITSFFRVVRDPATFQRFLDRVDATLHSREEFIWCKRTWRDCEDDIERAARWYYMIRFSINCKPNTTFGRSKNPVVTFADRLHKSLPLFYPIHRRLKVVTIENLDWRICLDDFDQNGFVWYLDPTYLDCAPGTYEHELSVADHKELIARVPYLKGFVAISGYDGPQTREIYDKAGLWSEVHTWERTTRARTQAEEEPAERTRVKEMLWIRHFR